MKKSKKSFLGLRIVLYSLLIIIAALTIYLSFRPDGFGVFGTNYNFYSCINGNGIISDGSCVVTDKVLPVSSGDKVALCGDIAGNEYPVSNLVIGVIDADNGNLYIHNSTGELLNFDINDAEVIVWQIGQLGNIVSILYELRFIIVAFWLLVFALIIVIEASAPNRKHKRYKREMIKTFEFYGEKYKEEDKEINY